MDVLSEEGFVCATQTERCYLSHKGLFILCTPSSSSIGAVGPFREDIETVMPEPSRAEAPLSESHSSERLAESRQRSCHGAAKMN